ncbi:MAG: M24 family metallopeptidase [Bacteriovoracia bacterium]
MAIQDFGEKFDLKKLFLARDTARDITYELASLIRPGMIEEDAHKLYKELCLKYPVEKQWHPPKLRFGPNTICNFKDLSVPYVLKEDDIFFIDIGPVVEGHEADYGETFFLGSNFDHKRICDAQKKVFRKVTDHWKRNGEKGSLLYEFAKKSADEEGFILNSGQDGHRIGDFPHHVHFRGGLAECEEKVIPNAWILEIHLWQPDKKYGAFFEDILSDQL